MITTNTILTRAGAGATIAVICFAVAACGSEQGTVPDQESHRTAQHAVAYDVAAQIEHRKAAFSQEMGRPQDAGADDVAAQIDHRKAAFSQEMGRLQYAGADDVVERVEQRKSAPGTL